MKKLMILIQIIIIIILLSLSPKAGRKYFLMNITFYSRHSDCISDKWNDGFTATMTPIRKGVCAINVDLVNGEWVVRSPLKLGQRIYIEGLGEFSVEDTGRFSELNAIQNIWTVDVFEPDHEKVVKGGKEVRKVYILEDKKWEHLMFYQVKKFILSKEI